jgi:4-nitrophenyl phosphatase
MIKGIILDIDGVLEFQEKVYPYAVETIRALRYSGYSLRFLTNSTLKSRASCADGLRKKGFIISDDEIITASYATANYLRNLKPRSCWVMLDGKGRDEFNEFVQDLKNPEDLVIRGSRSCFDFELSLRTMNLSTREIVVIGDRVSTDIAGAYILGLRSVLVKTGKS